MAARHIVVVGGNGFVGSAICKSALTKGFEVSSISSSGRPYTTPKGHSPAWTSRVKWHSANALQPESYAHILASASGVVHTIGTLFEGAGYKDAMRRGNAVEMMSSLLGRGGTGNPLEKGAREGSYGVMNRDTALRVCETFVGSQQQPLTSEGAQPTKPFVYVSAEDIFRPFVPAGYIESKRDAEAQISRILVEKPGAFRPVFIRPGLIYHAHLRPILSPAAALLGLSASVHAALPRSFPTPANVLRSLGQGLHGPRSSPLNPGDRKSVV